jgi:hypothetical protein
MSNCGDSLESVANEELRGRLQALVRKSHGTDAALLEHLGEVDARRLHLDEAFPSMFEYCVASSIWRKASHTTGFTRPGRHGGIPLCLRRCAGGICT